MGLSEDINKAVDTIVSTPWDTREGTVVPKTEDVELSDGAVLLDAVYLYADMADSTGLARDFARETAAKVVRAYLDATCRVLKAWEGEIRSFDGDRVMAIFVGSSKNTNAASAGLQVNYVVSKIVRPAVEQKFPSLLRKGYVVKHCVGIAGGQALIVRGGVRGDNDLVSIGRSPNIAAQLSEVRNSPFHTYITEDVYSRLNKSAKYHEDKDMWEAKEKEVGGLTISVYRSGWWWEP